MKERHLGTRLKQRKTGTQHWSSCKRYAVLISRVLHPLCEKPCLFLGHSWSPLHACFVLHNFSWAFWSTPDLEERTPDSYCMFWKDNMPILECSHVAQDVSVCFLILYTRGPSEKRSNYSIALSFAEDQRAQPLYCLGHALLCHKGMLIFLRVKQGKDTTGLNTVHAHEKDIFFTLASISAVSRSEC